MTKKTISLILTLVCAVSSIFAAQYLSVPLSDNAYRIIEIAEIKGIVTQQSDVKPYNASKVLTLLNEIRISDEISETERLIVEDTINKISTYYGNDENRGLKNIINKGFFRTASENSSATLGVRIHFDEMLGKNFNDGKILDSQNGGTFYFNGDLFNLLSYNVNISAMFDRRGEGAYLPNDFKMMADGNYFSGNGNGSIGEKVWGVANDPELAMSFFNDRVTIRWGSFDRDWGVGDDNFALASTASEFDAFEFYMKPAKWIEFTALQGSFQKFAFGSSDKPFGVNWLSDTYHENKYNNNYSLHRVTLNLWDNVKLSAYESVVWRKRNELSYYNPFAIYMFVQNQLSDYDSMLCGVDFSVLVKNKVKLYGAFGMTELNTLSLSTFLTHARHVISLQGGVEMPVQIGSFGKFGLQVTYLPPFWGTHYRWSALNPDNPFGEYETTFVNKGHTFSYPLYPDSLEFKLNLEANLSKDFKFKLTVKDQLRSAQYALDNVNGTTYETCIDYIVEPELGYENKDFFSYIWRNTLLIDFDATKTFDNYPFEIVLGIRGIADWKRSYDVSNYAKVNTGVVADAGYQEDNGFANKYNYGDVYNRGGADMGVWAFPEIRALAKLGVKVYY